MIFLICGLVAVTFVLCISVYLVVSGIPAIREIGLIHFLGGTKWASTAKNPKFGILPFILTSVYGTAGAVLIGVPLTYVGGLISMMVVLKVGFYEGLMLAVVPFLFGDVLKALLAAWLGVKVNQIIQR